jgi:halocyanin-like protein
MGATGGALAAGAATGTASAQGPDYGGWFSDVSNFDGTTVDKTGRDEVTVTVGADGNNGTFAYAPPAVKISPGTTVLFEWVSDTHNVVVESQPDGADWSGHEPIEDTGFSFESTFETKGIYTYFCQPHKSLGMKGAIVVDDSGGGGGGGGSSAEAVPAEFGDWFSDVSNYDGTTVDKTGQDEVTVIVGADGNNGSYAYEAPAVRVSPGTTVTFEWESDTHNVVVQDQPEGADWSGHEAIEDTGFSFESTFETTGVYTYFCQPHKSLGMKGAIVVGPAPGASSGGGREGGEHDESFQLNITPVLIAVGGGLIMAVLSPLLFGAFWRETGTRSQPAVDYELERVEPGEDGPPVTEEAPVEETAVELGHDEYDPVGTATLIIGYTLLITVLWIFMYFVEFLGAPTVTG